MYKVFYSYRKSGKKVVVEDNLTEKQAQAMVQEDIDSGVSTKAKMMCYKKM